MNAPASRMAPRSMYPGMLLCSLAVLMLEILLTRIFSFTIWYHLAYLTISTALLGFGAAGALLAVYPRLLEGDVGKLAARCSAAAGLLMLAAMAILAPRPLDPANLVLDPGSFFLGLLGYYVLITLPFFLAGIAVAAPLSAYPRQVDRLYAADLAGAGLGCVAAVLALSWLDGPAALTVCAALFVAAGAVYALPGRLATALVGVSVLLLCASPWARHGLPFLPAPSKVLGQSLQQEGTQMLYTRWSPVNRVDLYRIASATITFWALYGRSDHYQGPFPFALALQYDAHNGSGVYRVDGPDTMRLLDTHLLRIPYLLSDSPRVLVIGVGGGVDVLNALRRGASRVTAVELQPITVDLHNGMLADWTGGAFQRPEVELVAAEGRHYVRSRGDVYDQIQITMTDTFSAQSTGAYVLAESYLYTVEAFEDYFAHLSDDGLISLVLGDVVSRDDSIPPPFVARLALTAREALERRGARAPASHILRVSQLRKADAGSNVAGSVVSSLLVKKTPFEAEEVARIRAFSEDNGFELTLDPTRSDGSPLASLLNVPSASLRSALEAQTFRLEPVHDDRPFFYHVRRWRELLGGEYVHWEVPGSVTGQLMLLMMLGQAILLGAVLILVPLARGGPTGLSLGQTRGFLLYFLGLGLGFLLIEISFVQKYVLLLGYPTYSLSVTIFALLLFASLGAALSRRLWARPQRFLPRLLAATLACVAIEVLALPWVRDAFLATPLAVRIALTFLLQLPLGVCLGMYFPTGIEILRRHAPRLVPWAWGVNGVASVASTVLAVMLGMSIGFSGVVIVAAVVYSVGTLSLLRVLPTLPTLAADEGTVGPASATSTGG